MLKCLQRSCDFPVTVQDEDAHICLPYLEANVAAGAKGREIHMQASQNYCFLS